jgi:hypothetical protein
MGNVRVARTANDLRSLRAYGACSALTIPVKAAVSSQPLAPGPLGMSHRA